MPEIGTPSGTPFVNVPTKVKPFGRRGSLDHAFNRRAGNFFARRQITPDRRGKLFRREPLGHRAKFLRRQADQFAECFGKRAERIVSDLQAHVGDGGSEFNKQLLRALHAQAGQKMMRRRPGGFVKHAHQMELADGGDLRECVQVQRLGQMLLHVADGPLDRHLIRLDRVRAMR